MLAGGGGSIVNVSSGAAYRPLEGWSAYCAGKAGLAMLTRAIALETAGKGIRVFGFSPGTIDTEMQVKIRASGMNVISQIPRADLSPVEHAVRGLVYLCCRPATTWRARTSRCATTPSAAASGWVEAAAPAPEGFPHAPATPPPGGPAGDARTGPCAGCGRCGAPAH